MEKVSPVLIQQRGTLLEVCMRSTGDVLAYCQIGDDENVEKIADLLSAKRLPKEAMRLRQIVMKARKPQNVVRAGSLL